MNADDPFERRYPTPPTLTAQEGAHRQSRTRRMGLAILALCVLLAAAALVVILSSNRGDDRGAPPLSRVELPPVQLVDAGRV